MLEAEAVRRLWTMCNGERNNSHIAHLDLGGQRTKINLGSVESRNRLRRYVVEDSLQILKCCSICVGGNDAFLHGIESAYIIEAKHMICMGVREEHGVHSGDLIGQCLLTEVRRRIHLNMDGVGLDVNAGTPTTIAGVGRLAYRTLAPDEGNAR